MNRIRHRQPVLYDPGASSEERVSTIANAYRNAAKEVDAYRDQGWQARRNDPVLLLDPDLITTIIEYEVWQDG